MARMHARRKGKSGSKKPPVTVKPEWCKVPPEEIENLVIELGKKGYSSAMIGTILRDQYGIPSVRALTGKRITEILEENGIKYTVTIKRGDKEYYVPEDLVNLWKKSIILYRHLEKHKKDLHNKRGLDLCLSKIRRLEKYYRRVGKLPPDWKYDKDKVKTLLGMI
jgi:small subunit ribosomal protein S15